MSSSNLNVLFLCTGNSARSIIAEGILRKLGGETFFSYSAGSQPAGKPNPYALAVLREHDIDVSFARSKRWDEFADSDAPKMDLIITVCDNAAGETCPVWPGRPSMAHWGVPDPAAVQGRQKDILVTALHNSWIRNAPVRHRWMARPNRARFTGSIITNGDN